LKVFKVEKVLDFKNLEELKKYMEKHKDLVLVAYLYF